MIGPMTDPRRALVLLSGGQDSTTCLAWALDRYAHVETLGFDHALRVSSDVYFYRLGQQMDREQDRLMRGGRGLP